jgi:hypothetical protein
MEGVTISSHKLKPGGPGIFVRVICPLNPLPSLRLKSHICSVFSASVPSFTHKAPVLRHWRLASHTLSFALPKNHNFDVRDRIY